MLLDEQVGTISPDLYGYLLENLGTVIYDGVWVGESSKIPNIGGIRKELIDRLRDIKASVIRWPGGNFADYYDWKDGVVRKPAALGVATCGRTSCLPKLPMAHSATTLMNSAPTSLCNCAASLVAGLFSTQTPEA